ncbi:MAG: hypothetical protein O3A51_11300 [Verrucomicrobia bacterium]|nr:hypothetical protein [Verrucomicrobiota bacterium]
MSSRRTGWLHAVSGLIIGLTIGLPLQTEAASGEKQTWSVPIVMEKATVRGKVAVLETRREDRKAVEGLVVEVWSTKEVEAGRRYFRDRTEVVRDELLHETQTDEAGLFGLPLLGTGEYLLVIGEVQFRLTVVDQTGDRVGQDEPKVLLILVPKEVVVT